MAGERALPGLGLLGFWTPGSDGWNTGMDTNLRMLSALVNRGVNSSTTPLPATGSAGDIYIVPGDAASNANAVAIWDDGAWVFLTPREGWKLYARDTDTDVLFDGSSWAEAGSGGGGGGSNPAFNSQAGSYSLTNGDLSGVGIIEMNNAGANTLTVPSGLTGMGPVTVIQQGAGQTSIAAGTGVTIRSPGGLLNIGAQYGTVTLIPRGGDVYYLTGNLA